MHSLLLLVQDTIDPDRWYLEPTVLTRSEMLKNAKGGMERCIGNGKESPGDAVPTTASSLTAIKTCGAL